MDKYEEEIYKFLVQQDNFDALLKVMSKFSLVKKEVLNNFWDSVAKRLAEKVNGISPIWNVLNPPNKERNDAKLIIYKKEWKLEENHPFVGIAWETLYGYAYYGVWANIE